MDIAFQSQFPSAPRYCYLRGHPRMSLLSVRDTLVGQRWWSDVIWKDNCHTPTSDQSAGRTAMGLDMGLRMMHASHTPQEKASKESLDHSMYASRMSRIAGDQAFSAKIHQRRTNLIDLSPGHLPALHRLGYARYAPCVRARR